MLDPQQLRVFVSAARHLSFVTAGKELRISASQVSKAVAALEQSLRRKLFQRTTRTVRLTKEGEQLLPVARQALQTLRDAEEFFAGDDDEAKLTGRIRITSSHTLGIRRLADLVGSFHAAHPGVELDVVLTDQYLDLVEEGIDLAVRIMEPRDSSLIARRLSDNPIILCASRDYLRRHPRIARVSDLEKHALLLIPQHAPLVFAKAGVALGKVGRTSWVAAANGDFLTQLACGGAGIVARSAWGVERELEDGSLVRVDVKDQLVSNTAVYAVYPANRFMPKRLRLFVEHLARGFAR